MVHKKVVLLTSLQQKANELLKDWPEVRDDIRGKHAVKVEA